MTAGEMRNGLGGMGTRTGRKKNERVRMIKRNESGGEGER